MLSDLYALRPIYLHTPTKTLQNHYFLIILRLAVDDFPLFERSCLR
jgi:hypothetical protein